MNLRSISSITGCKYFSKKEIARKRQKNGHKLFVFIKQMKTIEIFLFMEIWKCEYSYKMQRNTFFFTNTFVQFFFFKKVRIGFVQLNALFLNKAALRRKSVWFNYMHIIAPQKCSATFFFTFISYSRPNLTVN